LVHSINTNVTSQPTLWLQYVSLVNQTYIVIRRGNLGLISPASIRPLKLYA